jgi:hypothetical protein
MRKRIGCLFDITGNGKNFVLTATSSPETALETPERNYSLLFEVMGQNTAADSESSLGNSLLGMRKLRERIFINQGVEEMPIACS